MRVVIAILAAATWYVPQGYSDPVNLYGGSEPAGVWVAVDVRQITGGAVCLGDDLIIHFIDYPGIPPLQLPAKDAGPIGDYYTTSFPGLPFAADIHYRAWPVALEGKLSARVRIINLSALRRLRLERSGQWTHKH